MLHGPLVRVKDLLWIKTAALQAENLVIAHIGDKRCGFRILAKELLAHKRAVFGLESLIFAVDALFHPLKQHSGVIARQKVVPSAAPDHLDHVPSGAAEG